MARVDKMETVLIYPEDGFGTKQQHFPPSSAPAHHFFAGFEVT